MQLTKKQHDFLPALLPPYANTTIAVDSVGKTMFQGHLLYFYLFEFVEGEPLRDILMKNPQLWVNHVGWLVISLSYAVAFLHSKGMFHFGLSPEGVLVRFDDKPNVPRVLLFDLGIASDGPNLGVNWYPFFLLPAYTAPELIDVNKIRADYATDVYGLGLILYELLVGEPAYTFKLHSDTEVIKAIQRNQRVRMNRVEDVRTLAQIAVQSVSQQVSQRQQDATVLAKQLLDFFGDVPASKKSRWPSLKTLMLVVVAALAIAFLIALAVSLTTFT